MDVVMSLVSDTFDDVVKRGWYATQDQFLASCLARDDVDRVVVVDAPRGVVSRAARMVRRSAAPPGPEGMLRVRPVTVRRTPDISETAVLRRYRAMNAEIGLALRRWHIERPALVAFNTWHAAVGRPGWAGATAFYAQDDESSIAHIAARRADVRHAYARIARSRMPVFTVSDELARRIGVADTAVTVPNGVDPVLWEALPARDDASRAADTSPVVTYLGTVDDRLDIDAVIAIGRAGFDVRVVGPLRDAEVVAQLSRAAGVTVGDRRPRREVVALLAASDVALLAHRSTPLTNAMSPLKLYEYVVSGLPVVATDLAGLRGQHPSVVSVAPGGDYVAAVRAALRKGRLAEADRAAAVAEFSWRARHRVVFDTLAAA